MWFAERTISDCNIKRYIRELRNDGWDINIEVPHIGNNYVKFVAKRTAKRPYSLYGKHEDDNPIDFANRLVCRRHVTMNDVFVGNDYFLVDMYFDENNDEDNWVPKDINELLN